MTTIVLQDIDDLATVVQNWHQDILMHLDELNDLINNPEVSGTINAIKEYIEPLPFNTEYSINLDVMNAN